MIRISKILFALFILFNITSCSLNSSKKTETPKATAEPIIISKGTVNTMSELFKASHPLEIKKKDQKSYYTCSAQLAHVIADLLCKTGQLDPKTNSDIISKIDLKDYDFELQFDGAMTLYLSLKNNVVFFEESKDIYEFWGNTSNLWDNITFDDKKNSSDLNEKAYQIMEKSFNSDINSDGTEEKISLIYQSSQAMNFTGDLLLRVNESDIPVAKSLQWQIFPSRTIADSPIIKYTPQSNSSNKLILVSMSWLVNDSNGTIDEIFPFIFKDNKLSLTDFAPPSVEFNYESGDIINYNFPKLNINLPVSIPFSDFNKALNKDQSLSDLLKDTKAFSNTPLAYNLIDINNDGFDELVIKSSLTFSSLSKISLGESYNIYKLSDDSVKLINVIISPPYIVEDKTTLTDKFVLDSIFLYKSIKFDGEKITDSWYKKSDDCPEEYIIKSISKLTEKGFIKKSDNTYSF